MVIIWFKKTAPFPYVIPSRSPCAYSLSLHGASIGWVLGRQSSIKAVAFSYEKYVHISSDSINCPISKPSLPTGNSLALIYTLSQAIYPIKLAKLSLSQISFHHFIVTMFPNHWWASSCWTIMWKRILSQACIWCARLLLKLTSEYVMQPALSIAAYLTSGHKTWSNFGNGNFYPNSVSS